ncbi:winged helix-turn-helix transcriptional regulator [Planobispora takensis]|nr:helix-turn-helix domain-containing protein [Planobispora takensis]
MRGSTTGRPIMVALDLLGRRWSLRVLWELREAPAGFRSLQERCDGMSSSVLRQRLLELEDNRLVRRTDDGRYELTPAGGELCEAIRPLDRWARRWIASLDAPDDAESPGGPDDAGGPGGPGDAR